MELLHSHADISGDILEPLARVGLPVAAVRAHHERLDGSGYPRGLRGRQVPFGAQILAVVDTWAALTRPRPHRPAISDQEALAVLRQQAGLGRLPAKLRRRPGAGGALAAARPPAGPGASATVRPAAGRRGRGPGRPVVKHGTAPHRFRRPAAGGLALSL